MHVSDLRFAMFGTGFWRIFNWLHGKN